MLLRLYDVIGMPSYQNPALHLYLAESVYKVVLHKSIPAQICQLILHVKDMLMDVCGIELL